MKDSEASVHDVVEIVQVVIDYFNVSSFVNFYGVKLIVYVDVPALCDDIVTEIVRIGAAHLVIRTEPVCIRVDGPDRFRLMVDIISY